MIGEERGPKPHFQKACARTACPDLFGALIAPRSLVKDGGEGTLHMIPEGEEGVRQRIEIRHTRNTELLASRLLT